jgi:hypothetical protein
MRLRTPSIKLLCQLTAAVAIACHCYFLPYCLMLEGKVYRQVGVDPESGQNIFAVEPRLLWRPPGNVPAVFAPAHWLDRMLRSEYWTTIEHSDGRKWKKPPRS